MRATLGTLAAEALRAPAQPRPNPPRRADGLESPKGAEQAASLAPDPPLEPETIGGALNGIDVLERQQFAPLRGLRIGLITNHTGHDRDRNSTIDLLKNAPGIQLKVLFSPEHGIRGALDEHVSDTVDAQTGLPIYSLYGKRTKPSARTA